MFDEGEDIRKLVHELFFHKCFFQSSFSNRCCQKVTVYPSFKIEEALLLLLRLMALVFDWVAALFILVGIPFQVTSAICELPTRVLARFRVSAWSASPDIHCFTSAVVSDVGSPKAQLSVRTYGSAWQVLRASDGKDLRETHK